MFRRATSVLTPRSLVASSPFFFPTSLAGISCRMGPLPSSLPSSNRITSSFVSSMCSLRCPLRLESSSAAGGPRLRTSASPSATSASSGPYKPAYSEISSSSASGSASTEAPSSSVIPVLDQLIGYYVNIQSRKMYYKDFLRMEHQAVRWAFADVRKNSEALAHGLLQTGVRPGDRILAIQPSNCETLVMQLACAKIGALLCVVPHQTIRADTLRYYLNTFQPVHLIAREWINVPERKANSPGGAEVIERNMHFWDTIYNVLPELGHAYPGQKFQWVHSQEFFFLKKVIITDHNMNLLGVTPMRRLLVWGPFSYYEQRLRRLSALLHPDDPVLALEDPHPALEDKMCITYSHRQCVNAGFLLGQLLGFKAETRFGLLPNHHINPIGSILAPFAALTSGAVLVHLHGDLFTVDHAINVMEKLCVEEVSTIFGTKKDFDLLLQQADNFDPDQFEHLRSLVLFEDLAEGFETGGMGISGGGRGVLDSTAAGSSSSSSTAEAGRGSSGAGAAPSQISDEYLQKLFKAFHLDAPGGEEDGAAATAKKKEGEMERDIVVFSGTMESCFLLRWRSLKKGFIGLVPHVEVKVVGDRGAGEAKIVGEGVRGALRLKGPHISGSFYNNAGLMTELIDEHGFTSTSRDAIVENGGKDISILPPQVY